MLKYKYLKQLDLRKTKKENRDHKIFNFTDKAGFTLIELLLSITMLMILGTAAITSYFNATASFAFLANVDNVHSTLKTARSFAVTNKAISKNGTTETPPRFGVYVTNQRIITFADNGMDEFAYDQESSFDPDSLIAGKEIGIDSDIYTLEVFGFDNSELSSDVIIFYEKGSGKPTVYSLNSSKNFEVVSPVENPFIYLKFRNPEEDLEKNIVLFLISGQTEEFFTVK